ncbi:MAG: chromosomal replication initiator DnaA [Pseudolabrys sp.]
MAGQASPRQLSFALDHAESFAREDFIAGPSNTAALAWIDCWPDWPERSMVLTGPEDSGKSHLAAIWAEQAGARILSARLLPQAALPAALSTGALVLEDLSPDGLDERALFHLLNLAREERAFLLLTARTPPAGWAIEIHDLGSRLRALPAAGVTAPDDGLLRALIVKLATDRQLDFDGNLVRYLAERIERSFAGARSAVARLDQEAMRQQRPVTRALAAELFRNSPM